MEKWQELTLRYFVARYNDRNPSVILYLLGGHKVKGNLNFPGFEIETAGGVEDFVKSEEVILETEEGLFTAHVSQIVAYTVIDTEEPK